MDYLEIANSFPMWVVAGIAVAVVLVQATMFARKSLHLAKDMGVSDKQIRSAAKSAGVSAVGPSLAILAGMVSLLVTMGGPISWMRLSFIGSVAYELMAAGFGADAMGVTLGGEGMNAVVFTNAVWAMTLGSLGWILFTALATHKMDKFRNVLAGGKKALIPIVSAAAMLGAFSYLTTDRLLNFNKGSVAAVVGFLVMSVLVIIDQKKDLKWLKEWSLTISMFIGMLVAALL